MKLSLRDYSQCGAKKQTSKQKGTTTKKNPWLVATKNKCCGFQPLNDIILQELPLREDSI